MKKKFFIVLIFLSIGMNLYFGGKWLLFEYGYTPNDEEKVIMSEMILKTVESSDYKKIDQKENIRALDVGIDKYKGGAFPYNMMVSVRTDSRTYLFSCSNKKCTEMEDAGTTYSIYMDEKPRLPFK